MGGGEKRMLPSWSGEGAGSCGRGTDHQSATDDQPLDQGPGSGLMPTRSKWSRTLLFSIRCPPSLSNRTQRSFGNPHSLTCPSVLIRGSDGGAYLVGSRGGLQLSPLAILMVSEVELCPTPSPLGGTPFPSPWQRVGVGLEPLPGEAPWRRKPAQQTAEPRDGGVRTSCHHLSPWAQPGLKAGFQACNPRACFMLLSAGLGALSIAAPMLFAPSINVDF